LQPAPFSFEIIHSAVVLEEKHGSPNAGKRAETRFWEFFINNIRNPHTRRAYGRALHEFLAWCEQHGLAVRP
jgi:hypothetical protein